jgi:hypothetical protein
MYFWCIVFRAKEKWNTEGACEDIPHAMSKIESAEVFIPIDKLPDPPQLPVATVISEPVQVFKKAREHRQD